MRVSFASPAAVVGVAAVVLATAAQVNDRAPESGKFEIPRTSWGVPDLQGVWEGRSNIPLERPAEFAGKEFLTEEEAAALDRKTAETNDLDRRNGKVGTSEDVNRGYNEFWREASAAKSRSRRTSLIVDPSDGKIPPLSVAGQNTESVRNEHRRLHGSDGPEDRGLFERCIMGLGGLPRLVGGTNSNVQIFQTPDQIVILHEMIHEVRIIPLDGRPHVPSSIRQWLGDSRGHWDGDTLVVDTTNFVDMSAYRRSSDRMHLVERFTRTSKDTLQYEVTIDDPAIFVRPWTAVLPMPKTDATIFEYACHEGNYGLPNQLRGARAEEHAHGAQP